MCKFYLPAPLSAKEFQRRGGQTQVHAPISQMSGAMFLFTVKFLLGKYDFDQYKGLSMGKKAQIRQIFDDFFFENLESPDFDDKLQ
jgi:hypothetical protein